MHELFVRSAKPFRERSCWVLILSCVGQPHLDSEHRLMKDLFANYSKEVRPVIDKEEPIPVNFDMMFSQLVELVCTAGKHLFLDVGRPIVKTLCFSQWYSFLYSQFQTWYFKTYTLPRDHTLFTLFISKVELDHFGLTIYVIVFLLLVFSGAFERLTMYFS